MADLIQTTSEHILEDETEGETRQHFPKRSSARASASTRGPKMQDSEPMYRSLVSAMAEGVCLLVASGEVLVVNPAAEQILGRSRDQIIGRTWSDLPWRTIHEDGRPFPVDLHPAVVTLRTGEPQSDVVIGICKADGVVTWISLTTRLLAGQDLAGGSLRVVLTFHDITERLTADRALRKSEAKFTAMFSLTPEPLILTRLEDGSILDVSRSYSEYFGYQPEEVIGRTSLTKDFGFWSDLEQRRQWRNKLIRQGEVLGFEMPLRRKDGTLAAVLVSCKLLDLDGEQCVITNIHDITERKHHAEHLTQIAHHDPLTSLPNRLLLSDRLSQAIEQNQRAGTRIAVCYLDFDGFKEVNDRFGHPAGDRLLVEAANRLQGCVRTGDTVARLGGDEFVILLCGLTDDEQCQSAPDRLLQAIAAPYMIGDDEQANISASIGVTLYPSDPADPETLVRHADHAMYVAKQAGKNRYHLFDTGLEQRIEARHATLRGLAEALASEQFRLHYQPKVDCRQGLVVGAEALIRWQHPTLGLLPPAKFVPLIEDTDLALAVGEWVIREALSQIVAWRRQDIDLNISVNAFARQLLQSGFVGVLGAILDDYPEAGSDYLQIEIVETAALQELDAIRQVIEDCKKLGVTFSLDDFGTGYSTLTHLRYLPAGEIKIDQSFVRQALTRPEDRVIVEAVIGLGRAFDRTVVAEGVETPGHINQLLALGCHVMQGYALARPMTAEDFTLWLRRFVPDPAWVRREHQTRQREKK